MKSKIQYCLIFIFSSAAVLSAPVFMLVYMSRNHQEKIRIPLFLLILSVAALFIIFFFILRPVLRLNDTVSSILNDPNLNSVTPEEGSLFEKFQALMDKEYNSRISFHQAALDALQSQINPHFLYNTLECIRGQAIIEGSRTIANMAKALSEFFRYTISTSDKLVLFNEEVKNVQNYIKIQNYRFNDRYEIRLHVNDEDRGIIEKSRLPRLTLQPIVENSLLHGLKDLETEKEFIDIDAAVTRHKLIVRLIDYGVGMPQEQLDKLNESLQLSADSSQNIGNDSHKSIALNNINQRIKLTMGSDYGLRVYSTLNAGCTVEILLPRTDMDFEGAGVF